MTKKPKIQKPDEKYMCVGDQLITVIYVNDDWVVPSSSIISTHNSEIYDNREDALYSNVVKRLKKGVSIDNYRNSKYFSEYLKRLEVEYPEYLL